jgi:CBS domain-containing protein
MKCLDVMTAPPLTLQRDEPVAAAVERMLAHRLSSLPVTDDRSRYLGVFRLRRFLGLMLPKAATVDHLIEDVSFVSEGIDDLKRRLAAVRDQAVAKHVDDTLPTLRPDMPLAEVLLLLYRSGNTLPVVEKPGGKLLGVVTSWDVLDRMTERN